MPRDVPPAPPRAGRSIRALLLPLLRQVGESDLMRADSLGFWRAGGEAFFLPRFVFQRTRTAKPRIKVAIFAGVHGDEPAGVLGLIELVRALHARPEMGRDYQLWLYPLCNPGGYVDGTRKSRFGKDLNREFWRNSSEPEVRLIEEELRRENFQGIISLHSDDTSDGVYGFAGSATLNEHLLRPALAAAQNALPRNDAARIDGFHAEGGVIHSAYDGTLSAPPGGAPAPFEIVLETPQRASLRLQRHAFLFALHAILSEYRRMISYAQNI